MIAFSADRRALWKADLTCCSSLAGVLIAVVPTVVVAVTGPVVRDAAAAGALELAVGAGPSAAHFIAAIPAVIICNHAQTINGGWTYPGECYNDI